MITRRRPKLNACECGRAKLRTDHACGRCKLIESEQVAYSRKERSGVKQVKETYRDVDRAATNWLRARGIYTSDRWRGTNQFLFEDGEFSTAYTVYSQHHHKLKQP